LVPTITNVPSNLIQEDVFLTEEAWVETAEGHGSPERTFKTEAEGGDGSE